MLALFDPHTEGYRLHRVEVYNWGTFDGLHIIEPKGANALLTGANGSGKSTLVDALITLLVPPLQRGYNQASGGAQKRGERDVKSYVQGEYGRVLDDDDRDKRLRLRSREHYTVLLGVFVNASSRRTVSLAQLIWLEGEKPDIVYVLAEKPLNISADLAFSGNKTQFKSQLKGISAEVFDEFSRYSSRFRSLFNLRSEKALELFNKIVSLKEISGLNDFVRNYMLEKLNAKALVEGLYGGYENLTSVHGMILKARRQRDHLQPLREEWNRYSTLKGQIEEARACADVFPHYVANRQIELLGSAIQRTEQAIKEFEEREAEASIEREAQQEEHTRIKTTILNDDAGRRLEELAQQIKVQEQERYKRQKQSADYSRMAMKFGLSGYSTEEAFRANIQQIPRLQSEIDIAYQALTRKRDELVGQRSGLDRNIADLEGQLTSLRGRKSQIPSETFEIRVQIVNALGIRPEDLPFVGELLKVKESEARWQPAIERLLRSYGQQVLVPDRYYQAIRQYVDQTSLRGRLIYHRITDVQSTSQPEHSGALFDKIEINPEAPGQLAAWLTLDLTRNYDYICCETPQAFDSTPRAITLRGQIKHSRTRHEKDDRKGFGDPSGYVLGWDNRAKVEALQKHLQAAKDQARQLRQDIEAIEAKQESQNEKRQNLRKLAEVEHFESIDYKAIQTLIDDLQSQRDTLQASADRLNQLRTDLARVELKIREQDAQIKQFQMTIGGHKNELTRFTVDRERCEQVLRDSPNPSTAERYTNHFTDYLADKTLTLDNAEEISRQGTRFFFNRAASLNGQQNQVQSRITSITSTYRNEYPVETTHVDVSIESVPVFLQILHRIEHDDLPTHEDRFRTYLSEEINHAVTNFQNMLTNKRDEYIGRINELNAALRQIEYTQTTLIQLTHQKVNDDEIMGFQRQLRDVFPDVGQPFDSEAQFQRIDGLIRKLKEDTRWMERVTDPRNWLQFGAQEIHRETDKQVQYYADSAGKSGGQKAKLAYTILASAIADQYQIHASESHGRSFRFIAVDEAFSKSDEANARYAMNLFSQLRLQVLVVTPLDKINVAEPYIRSIHLVRSDPDTNKASIVSMSIEEYRERRETTPKPEFSE